MVALREEAPVRTDDEPSRTAPPETFWTPRRVKWALLHVPELRQGVAPPRDPREGRAGGKRRRWAGWERPVDTFESLRRAMLRLAQLDRDPRGAGVLWSLYFNDALACEKLTVRRSIVADDEGVTARTIYNWEDQAVTELARILGWRPATRDEERE